MPPKKPTGDKPAGRRGGGGRRGPDGLTDLERLFVIEYLTNGNNGARAYAAVASGSPGLSTASGEAARILQRPQVKARIDAALFKAAGRLDVTAERVLAEVARVAFATMGDFVRIADDGTPVLDFKRAGDDGLRVVSEIQQEEYVEGRGEDAERVKKTKFKLHDKLAALDKLMRHLGMLREKVEHTGKDGGPIDIAKADDATLLALIASLDARGSGETEGSGEG